MADENTTPTPAGDQPPVDAVDDGDPTARSARADHRADTARDRAGRTPRREQGTDAPSDPTATVRTDEFGLAERDERRAERVTPVEMDDDRLRQAADVQGVDPTVFAEAIREQEEKTDCWVVSNRADNRVVLWERDADHPGGEAFVGGGTPTPVARTAEVERLLHAGLLVEIPPPPASRKLPVPTIAAESGPRAAQPGQPIRLNRPFDPDVVPEEHQDAVRRRMAERRTPAALPVPAGVEMPPDEEPDRSTTRGRRGR